MDQNNRYERVSGRFNSAFSQPLFRTICILMTIATVISAFSISVNSESGSFKMGSSLNIFSLLLTIGAWIIYGKAKKDDSPLSGMKLVSGVIKAKYIIAYILYGLFLSFIPLFIIMFAFVGLPRYIALPEQFENWMDSLPFKLSTVAVLLIGAFIAVVCIAGIVINAVFYRRVHKFTKSACLVESGNAEKVECADVARGWYMVFGVIYGVAAGLLGITSIVNRVINLISAIGNAHGTMAIVLTSLMLLHSVFSLVSGILLAVVYVSFSKFIKNNMELLK